jgi:CspA family cold shock protein
MRRPGPDVASVFDLGPAPALSQICAAPGTKDKVMAIGTVKFFNADKGYGFIAPEGGGGDAFVHISAVEAAGMATLDRDQRVSYELEEDRRGKVSAVKLAQA